MLRIIRTTCLGEITILAKSLRKTWWLRAESNHRHKDFQSSALPTELLSHHLEGLFNNKLTPRSRDFAKI